MYATELWTELGSYLQMDTAVTQKVGGSINVGELFTVRFTVRNVAPAPSAVTPLIRFKNPYLYVAKTDYACPILPDGNPVDGLGHELSDVLLEPGEAVSEDRQMLAIKAIQMASPADWFRQEDIAKVWATGHLDLDAFFKVCTYKIVKAQINYAWRLSDKPIKPPRPGRKLRT